MEKRPYALGDDRSMQPIPDAPPYSSVLCCRVLPCIAKLFCDRNLRDGDSRDVLAAITRSTKKAPKVVMMASYLNRDSYDQPKRAGIFEAIPTPCAPTHIEVMVILARKQ